MKRIQVHHKENRYDIFIDNNILSKAGEYIKSIYDNKNIAVITDENVFKLYGNKLKESLEKYGSHIHFIVVKPGEESKSIKTLSEVLDQLTEQSIKRSDLIVAFGGGVIGDLAGFVASIYLRGIDYVQIPTTLLSQIDSSIGGKTAINLRKGKNLAGTFYQPKLVLIDPSILNSLTDDCIKDGMGEVIKYACIKDAQMFEMLTTIKSKEQLFDHIEYIIYTCCNIKRAIVEVDEKDTGLRMILNFGHTLAHAIENYFNYQYSHGQAVGVGMYYITEKSEELGYTKQGTAQRIKDILMNFNMEHIVKNVDDEYIRKTIKLDKKNIKDNINLILLKEIGDCFIKKVPEKNISAFF